MKNESFWKFIDNSAAFVANNPQNISCLYFPLANEAEMMSSIAPDLKGDIKTDNNSFLMLPLSRSDLAYTNSARGFWIYLNPVRKFPISSIKFSNGVNKTKKAWPLCGADSNNTDDKTMLQAGLLYHKIIRKNPRIGLEAEITNFVPVSQDRAELMLIKITNISKTNIEITPTSAIPMFARSADNLRDHRHVTSLLHRITQDKYGVIVKPVMSFDERGHKINETAYYVFGIDSDNQAPVGSFPTQESFIKEGGSLNRPLSVINNLPAKELTINALSGKEAMGALRFKAKKLKPRQSTYFALILGISKNKNDISKTLKRFNSIGKINSALNENKIFWKNKINSMSFNTGDYIYDNWLRWVKLQPILRKIYGCSFLPDFDYGHGGKGWRDLWQDCLALLLTNPQDIRKLLIANFSGVRIDGTNATIITKKPGVFIADRNKISRVWMDHGIWPFFTLRHYINQTGDLGILLEKTTYFKDSQIMRSKEIDFSQNLSGNLKTHSEKIYRGTILEHILAEHLVQFFNVGSHNCIRLENADWNDGLDMAAQKGESVAFSSFYAFNLHRIADVLEKLKQDLGISRVSILKEIYFLLDTMHKHINYNSVSKKIEILNNYLVSVKSGVSGRTFKIRIDDIIIDLRRKANWLSKHIYDKEWINISKDAGFFNGYYDNQAKRVEGKFNGLIKMTLTGQVFPVLSGVASNKQVVKIFKAAKKYLQDKKLKGFRLNTDFKQPQFNLGRAFAFAYGEKENGAIFSHMCVMFAYALYRRGFVKEGFEVLDSLKELALNSNTSKIYPNLPEYFNLDGRGMYSYLTGSASWYIMTLLTQTFGVRGQFGDLVIAPKLVKENFEKSKELSVQLNFANKRLNITYLNPKRKDYSQYSIKEVRTDIAFKKITEKEILIKKSSLKSYNSGQINIKIILG